MGFADRMVSAEQIQAAKELNLFDYLQQACPSELVREYRNEYHMKSHETLKINSGGYWHWMAHPDIFGRSLLDYLMKVEEKSLPDAVLEILDGRYIPSDRNKQTKPEEKKPFRLPDRCRYTTYLNSHLRKRGIDQIIIDSCIQEKILYESTPYHNCVFVGRDPAGVPRFASMRSTAGNYRQEVAGSKKEYAFHLPADNELCTKLSVFEAPIDLLSDCTIDLLYRQKWRDVHRISMAGTSLLSVRQYLIDRPWIDTIHLCRDNDEAGLSCLQSMKEEFEKEGYLIHDTPSLAGKDYNDWVMKLQGLAPSASKLSTHQR